MWAYLGCGGKVLFSPQCRFSKGGGEIDWRPDDQPWNVSASEMSEMSGAFRGTFRCTFRWVMVLGRVFRSDVVLSLVGSKSAPRCAARHFSLLPVFVPSSSVQLITACEIWNIDITICIDISTCPHYLLFSLGYASAYARCWRDHNGCSLDPRTVCCSRFLTKRLY